MVGGLIEEGVRAVEDVLEEHQVHWPGMPPWMDWATPGDFVAAIDMLTKHKTAATASMEERVAARWA